MSEEKQIPSRSAQNPGFFGWSFRLQAVSAKTGKRMLQSPLRLRGRASGLWKMSGKGRPYTGKHPSSISKLADQASPPSVSLGVKGGQRLHRFCNLPATEPGTQRALRKGQKNPREGGRWFPTSSHPGRWHLSTAAAPRPAPSLRQPLTLPGSDVAPENSDAQVPPAGRRGAHPPPSLLPSHQWQCRGAMRAGMGWGSRCSPLQSSPWSGAML